MRDTGLNGAREEAQGLHPRGLGNESSNAEIVPETAELAEISRRGEATPTLPSPMKGEGVEEARQRQACRVRMAAMDALRERYGDQPIPERVMKSHGLVLPRNREGRRARARRERVLSEARALCEADVPVTVPALAAAIGGLGPRGAARIKHAIAELVRAGQWPPAAGGGAGPCGD
jgi:hypothetical protein